jgi:hypothetical protein
LPESDGDKTTFFANLLINLLATQKVVAIHLTFTDALLHLGLPHSNVYIGGIQAIVEVLHKLKALGPDGTTNEMLEKTLLTGMHYLYLLEKTAMVLGAFLIRWKTATVVRLPQDT